MRNSTARHSERLQCEALLNKEGRMLVNGTVRDQTTGSLWTESGLQVVCGLRAVYTGSLWTESRLQVVCGLRV